jgi:spore coat polysaccharide biosynthesis protein SpsF
MEQKTNVVAIIQARMGSTRLPGKVLADISGKPMLWHLVQRLREANCLCEVVVATSEKPSDNLIESFCREQNISCFRGSEEDVLDRFYQAAKVFRVDIAIRITADCPLMDGRIIDDVFQLLLDSGSDYAGNCNFGPATFPDGLDVEMFTFATLECAWKEADKRYQREHVTSYITENSNQFKCENLLAPRDLNQWRLTVDEPEDLELIREIFKSLDRFGELFSFQEVVAFLDEHPDFLKINSRFARNEGYNTEDI